MMQDPSDLLITISNSRRQQQSVPPLRSLILIEHCFCCKFCILFGLLRCLLRLVRTHLTYLLCLSLFLVCVFPIIYTLDVRNPVYEQVFGLLQSNNVVSNTTSDCDYLRNSVTSWLLTVVNVHNRINIDEPNNPNLAVLWAQVLPVRCDWQRPDGVITFCGDEFFDDKFPACSLWKETMPTNPDDASPQYFARVLGVRPGELTEYIDRQLAPAFFNYSVANADETGVHDFYVRAIFNDSSTVALVYVHFFLACWNYKWKETHYFLHFTEILPCFYCCCAC